MAKRRAAARALIDSEVVRVADEAVVAKPKRMREVCPLCQRDLALVGRVHHCVPQWAPVIPGSGRSIVMSLVSEVPRRVDFQRIGGRHSSRLTKVMVNGKVIIPKTRSPFEISGALAVQGWCGQVELWRGKKLVGVRDIASEARRLIAAHRLTFRKR